MTKEAFSLIAPTLPNQPGIYKYFDSEETLIYVGKAKFLRKRISSYFNGHADNKKTIELVKKIHRIEFTIVDNEADAFFLENSLIKEYQPRYNINLKDDKSYPYVVIKNEPFPRVFFTRKKLKDKSTYFGPYTSTENAREIIDFIKQYFPLRTCTLNLDPKKITKKKYKVCLEYHLGNCKGPCEGLQDQESYDEGIQRLKLLLKGNLTPLFDYLKSQVLSCSQEMAYEKAAQIQKKINQLQEYKVKSAVVNTQTGNLDVFSIVDKEEVAIVNYLAVNDGAIIHTKTVTLQKKLSESKEELLVFAMLQLREIFNSEAKEAVLPFEVSYPDKEYLITVPKIGDKKKLMDLSFKNANYFIEQLEKKERLYLNPKTNDAFEEIICQLQKELHLPSKPLHIECFDNSNLQGTNPVAAMVCFRNGQPSKKDYRHYNIKTVEGIDDFASMKEVVYRRYKRLLEEKLSIPSLIIIDGGKGQLNAANESIIELGLAGKTTLVGLAKNKEEIFYIGDKASLILPWKSESLQLIRRIRDEVHRFGLSFHRNQRSRSALPKNELEQIPGIGKETANMLMKQYKSIKNIQKQPAEELAKTVNKAKAEIIFNYLKNKKP